MSARQEAPAATWRERLADYFIGAFEALIMRPHIARAYLVAALGSIVIGLLGDSSIKGFRALAIMGSGCMLWAFAVAEAALSVLAHAMELGEFERARPFMDLFEKQEAPARASYLMQVSAGHWVASAIDPNEFNALAIGLLNGRPFSERAWSGRVRNFRTVQDLFEKRGLVVLKGNKRILNSHGRRALLAHVYGHAAFQLPAGKEVT